MKQEQFNVIMPYVSADLVAEISKRQAIPHSEALRKLYSSKLYELLENESTKVWQYSTQMLYSLFVQGEKNGKIQFPDV